MRSGTKQAETDGDTSTAVKGSGIISATGRNRVEASGIATRLTTASDIHQSLSYPRSESLAQVSETEKSQLIYTLAIPPISCVFLNSSATGASKWVKIFVRQWTNTRDFHSDYLLRLCVESTYWLGVNANRGVRSSGKLWTFTFRLGLGKSKHEMESDLDDCAIVCLTIYTLLYGFLNTGI